MQTQFSYREPGQNTCNGDSGGPAFADNGNGELLVAGVTSYGDFGCHDFGVDTRVDAYLDFLDIQDGGTGENPVDPCQGETFEGRCDGDTVIWCENNSVHRTDCSDRSQTCGFSEQNNYFACVERVVADPCQGETYEGRCDGDTVIWCENDAVQSIDCASLGAGCGFESGRDIFNCIR